MPEPLHVSIPNRLGRTEARKRIDAGLANAGGQFAALGVSMEHRWSGDRLAFRALVLGQSVTGHIEVLDKSVEVEVYLPGILGLLGAKIAGRIKKEGTLLLAKD